jgi:hypothetical protein
VVPSPAIFAETTKNEKYFPLNAMLKLQGKFIQSLLTKRRRYIFRITKNLSKSYLPTEAQKSCFKRILKFTLKQLLHVSVQSPSTGSVIFELAKLTVIKIIS